MSEYEEQIVELLKENNSKMDKLIRLLDKRDGEWQDTTGALRILEKKNPRVLIKARLLMGPKAWRQEGKFLKYRTEDLKKLRARMDSGDMTL